MRFLGLRDRLRSFARRLIIDNGHCPSYARPLHFMENGGYDFINRIALLQDAQCLFVPTGLWE